MQITKADFDKAVAQPWDGRTCLMAQAIKRCGMEVESNVGPYFFAEERGVGDVVELFDKCYCSPGGTGAIIKKWTLEFLRESLPITVPA